VIRGARRLGRVYCHLPLYAGTEALIDGALLRRMKRDATFINTARGAVVNEPELIEVLQERPDLQAVLDTIVEEPPLPGHALLALPNAFVTPHIAGSMCFECRRMGLMMVDELRRYHAGEPLLGEVREDNAPYLSFTGRPVLSDLTAASARTMAWRPSAAPTGIGFLFTTASTNAASSAR